MAGLASVLALVDVFNRDLRFVLNNLLTVWFFLVPIVYARRMADGRLDLVRTVDPMNHVIARFRDVLYDGPRRPGLHVPHPRCRRRRCSSPPWPSSAAPPSTWPRTCDSRVRHDSRWDRRAIPRGDWPHALAGACHAGAGRWHGAVSVQRTGGQPPTVPVFEAPSPSGPARKATKWPEKGATRVRPTASKRGRTRRSYQPKRARRVPTTWGAWRTWAVASTVKPAAVRASTPGPSARVCPTAKGTSPVRAGEPVGEGVAQAHQGVAGVVEGQDEPAAGPQDPAQLDEGAAQVVGVVEVVEGRGGEHAVEGAGRERGAPDVGHRRPAADPGPGLGRHLGRDVGPDPGRGRQVGEEGPVGRPLLEQVGLEPSPLRLADPAPDQRQVLGPRLAPPARGRPSAAAAMPSQ